MSYLISKLVGPFRYYAKIWYQGGEIVRLWYGIKNNATSYNNKGLAEADIMSLILQLSEPESLEIMEL